MTRLICTKLPQAMQQTRMEMDALRQEINEHGQEARSLYEKKLCAKGFTAEQVRRIADLSYEIQYNLWVYGQHPPPGPSPFQAELHKLYERPEAKLPQEGA